MKVLTTNNDRSSDGYEVFSESIRNRFQYLVGSGKPLFTTNATNLFDVFLDNLPEEGRQHYTCHACRRFVDTYGGLVTILEDGSKIPVMWSDAVPDFFAAAIYAIMKAINKAQVTGIFISSDKVWGTPITGDWHHMSVIPPKSMVYYSRTQTAGQKMAEKREDFKMLLSGLRDFSLDAVIQAVKVLRTDTLYRSEKVLGIAEWFKQLHEARSKTKSSQIKRNLTWLAVATAPAGFCHVRSSMIGTLLSDIVDGLSFDVVSRRFSEKMHPLRYQRPQSAPTIGNVAQAEKVIEQMGVAKSLERRFARLEELQTIWTPLVKEKTEPAEGVFAHLKTKNGQGIEDIDLPPQTMTWIKFLDSVLPTAQKIEFRVKHVRDNFVAFITAVHNDAPPILQWDFKECRNQVSHYVYNNGSLGSQWGLSFGWCLVNAVCYQPSMWNNNNGHQGKSVNFILDGAKDSAYKHSGIALFPEILKSEFHGIRATIEAYSNSKELSGYDEASACGIRLQAGSTWSADFRVTSDLGKSVYRLDRWD